MFSIQMLMLIALFFVCSYLIEHLAPAEFLDRLDSDILDCLLLAPLLNRMTMVTNLIQEGTKLTYLVDDGVFAAADLLVDVKVIHI